MKLLLPKSLLLLLLVGAVGCTKEDDVALDDVIKSLTVSPTTLPADGTTQAEVVVKLPTTASDDRRNVVITTKDGGKLGTPGADKITVKAEFENGELVARTMLTAPLAAGTLTISAKPEIETRTDYIRTAPVMVTESLPKTIRLNPSSLGIGRNFIDQVRVVGTIRNADNGKVSKGTRVRFNQYTRDSITNRYIEAVGRFRSVQASSNDTARVSAIYSAPRYRIGTVITIRATVVDADGNDVPLTLPSGAMVPIVDSVLLTVNRY